MTRSSTLALRFIDSLANRAQRLAAKDVVVARLYCDWQGFGSWDLEVQRGSTADTYADALLRRNYDVAGPDVLRFVWDGKEHLLTVSSAPTEPLTSPGPWKRVLDQSFQDSEQAAAFAEDYAVKWAAGVA